MLCEIKENLSKKLDLSKVAKRFIGIVGKIPYDKKVVVERCFNKSESVCITIFLPNKSNTAFHIYEWHTLDNVRETEQEVKKILLGKVDNEYHGGEI